MRFSTPESLAVELDGLSKLLEVLFEDPSLSRLRANTPTHPAVTMHDRIQALARGEAVPLVDEDEYAFAVWTLGLDRSTWASGTIDDGLLEGIGGQDARHQVQSRIGDPEQYFDVLAELFFLGWLREEGYSVDLREQEGRPDIEVSSPFPYWAEVKRISFTSQPTRIRRVIAKANKQIKAATPGETGPVFVHIARAGHRLTDDDRIPTDVTDFIREAEREMNSGHSRSVSHAVISWDDAMVIGGPSEGASLYAFRRRSMVIPHAAPRSTSPMTEQSLQVGRTVTAWVRYPKVTQTPTLPSVRLPEVHITQQYRQTSEFDSGVRPGHVADILSDPDADLVIALGGSEVRLATRLVDRGMSPYVTLIECVRRGDGDLDAVGGYKLFGPAEQLAILASDPMGSFVELIRRFGTPLRIGQIEGKFIGRTTFQLDAGQTPFAEGLGDAESLKVSMLLRVEEGSPRIAHVSWAYALDTARYAAACRRRAAA